MASQDFKRYSHRRKQRRFTYYIPHVALGLIIVGVIGSGTFMYTQKSGIFKPAIIATESEGSLIESVAPTETALSIDPQPLLDQAAYLAAGYDYDSAIALLQSDATYLELPEVQSAIAEYENIKTTLVKADPQKITHVFFHSLVMDNAKAFDGDPHTKGYNQVMTTSSEFLNILESMYERGFVLVRIHDIAYETTNENGETVFETGSIMLPEGKQPFVMSQDDVCYYPYMAEDGFANKIVVGTDGKPTCEKIMDDGTVSTGSYDLIPLLEDFIQEHPDFSYKGARAIIAFTGYEGILGYRTTASYSEEPTFEQDKADAARVAQCLRDNGWELASHSWGHLNMGEIAIDRFKIDSDKWTNEVESLIGPTDIILFPFGSDIGSWRPYTHDNEKFDYLYQAGFRYLCNVDSSQYWVQIGADYMRQGRRNLDGYRMYYDLIEPDTSKRWTHDLFNVEDIFDPERPTPVPPMGQ